MTYDVAIIGLGAVGSAAAFHCCERGLRVIGFDRFSPPHTLGSSHGGSRIIRRAYFEGAMYVPILNRAYALWERLEERSRTTLFHRIGALTAAPVGSRVLDGAAAAALQFDIPHDILEASEVRERFPAICLRQGERGLWEPNAGWLHPEVAIRTQLALARDQGADLRRGEPAESWRAVDGGLRIATNEGDYTAARLIVCAGGWMRELVDLPLTIERQVNVWYRPRKNATAHAADRCPVYIWEYEPDRVLYGFPDLGDGVKAGLHHHGRPVEHPDELEREVRDDDVRALSEQLSKFLPDACGSVAKTAVCFYTNAPDERFLVDIHRDHPNVVFASACSGHGFKASIAVGEILAALSADEEPAVDISPFGMANEP